MGGTNCIIAQQVPVAKPQSHFILRHSIGEFFILGLEISCVIESTYCILANFTISFQNVRFLLIFEHRKKNCL